MFTRHTAHVHTYCKEWNWAVIAAGFPGSHLCVTEIADSTWAEGECVCMHMCIALFAYGCRIELYCTTSTNTGNVLSLPSISVYSVVVNLFI